MRVLKLSKIISNRNSLVTRLENKSLRLKRKLIKKKEETYKKLNKTLASSGSKSPGNTIINGIINTGLFVGLPFAPSILRSIRGVKPSNVRGANNIVNFTRNASNASRNTRNLTNASRGLKFTKGNVALNTLAGGLDYTARIQEGQTQTQAISGSVSGVAGGIGGAAIGMKVGMFIGGALGTFFFGAGAIPGAAIGGTIGSFIGGWIGASGASRISDWFTGADKKRKEDIAEIDSSKIKTPFSKSIDKFAIVLGKFDRYVGGPPVVEGKDFYGYDLEKNISTTVPPLPSRTWKRVNLPPQIRYKNFRQFRFPNPFRRFLRSRQTRLLNSRKIINVTPNTQRIKNFISEFNDRKSVKTVKDTIRFIGQARLALSNPYALFGSLVIGDLVNPQGLADGTLDGNAEAMKLAGYVRTPEGWIHKDKLSPQDKLKYLPLSTESLGFDPSFTGISTNFNFLDTVGMGTMSAFYGNTNLMNLDNLFVDGKNPYLPQVSDNNIVTVQKGDNNFQIIPVTSGDIESFNISSPDSASKYVEMGGYLTN